jgi:hypothetical protein
MGEKWPVRFSQTIELSRNCWVLLHAAKLRHGTDGFTSPPKEDILRISIVITSNNLLLSGICCHFVFFFLSFNLLTGRQLSIWICCKPLISFLYNCQLLCFWPLTVEVFPWHFFLILLLQGCLIETRYA